MCGTGCGCSRHVLQTGARDAVVVLCFELYCTILHYIPYHIIPYYTTQYYTRVATAVGSDDDQPCEMCEPTRLDLFEPDDDKPLMLQITSKIQQVGHPAAEELSDVIVATVSEELARCAVLVASFDAVKTAVSRHAVVRLEAWRLSYYISSFFKYGIEVQAWQSVCLAQFASRISNSALRTVGFGSRPRVL